MNCAPLKSSKYKWYLFSGDGTQCPGLLVEEPEENVNSIVQCVVKHPMAQTGNKILEPLALSQNIPSISCLHTSHLMGSTSW